VLLTDTRVAAGATVVRSITDKQVVIATGCRVGSDTDLTVSEMFPDSINTGLTLLGKNTRLPAGLTVGGNCVVGSDLVESDFAGLRAIPSGKSFRVQPI
jgi:glucose-1-phosphate adenylyltransferase